MQNLELEISSGEGEGYRVAARSDAGDTAGTLSRFPFDERDLGRRLQAVEFALMRSAATLRRLVAADEQPVQEFGAKLFEFLFPVGVREHLATVRGQAAQEAVPMQVRLRIRSPELHLTAAAPHQRQARLPCLRSTVSARDSVRFERSSAPRSRSMKGRW